MRDPRLDKLARVLVAYSTGVKPGQLVRISGDPVAIPLMEAIYEHVIRAGAHVQFRCAPDSLQDLFFAYASDEQLRYLNPLALEEIKTIDVSIG
ncbi:MAG TPA: aminopeptidase, partial [Phycisphaeraceae bacterium]